MQASGKRWITYGSREAIIKIWALADIHYGAYGCEVDRLTRDIEKIRQDPYSFWVGIGDYGDYVGIGDKRFDPNALDPTLTIGDLAQLGFAITKKMRDLLMPIAGKCLGLGIGNHDYKYQQINQQANLHGWLCTELKTPNLGYCSLFDIVFTRRTVKHPVLSFKCPEDRKMGTTNSYRVFIHHGAGGALTPGGKLNRLTKFMEAFDADLYFCGHVHDQIAKRIVTLGADSVCGKITQKERLGVVTGSYLKTYNQGSIGYGEMKGYAPVPLGAICVEIKPDKGEMHARI